MSKLGCSCGEVISDTGDHLPYKGALFSDTEFFDLPERISADVADYIQKRLAGTAKKQLSWRQRLAEYFRNERPMRDEELIGTIVARHLIHSHSDVYQCSKCGRLHVQRRRSNRFDSFAPDDIPHRDVFKINAG